MKTFRNLVGLATLSLAVSAVADGGTLTIGNPAPAINVLKWAKGTPVTSIEKGKVYVFEFWATWCGPCKQSIPHLTELAKKYAGKVTFTGVDSFEHDSSEASYVPKVEKFVSDMGDKMAYNVAIDGVSDFMGKNWLNAAKVNTIPSALVIDGTGTIAWIGHPMEGLDEALGQILAGTYDKKAAADKRNQEIAASDAAQAKIDAFMIPMRQGKFPDAVAAMDKAFASDAQLKARYYPERFVALATYDAPASSAYAREMAQGNPAAAYQIGARLLLDKSPIKSPDYALAIELLNEAATDGKNPSIKALALDRLAAAYAKQVAYDKAAASEEQALAAATGIPGFPDAMKTKWQASLDDYKKNLKSGK